MRDLAYYPGCHRRSAKPAVGRAGVAAATSALLGRLLLHRLAEHLADAFVIDDHWHGAFGDEHAMPSRNTNASG